VKVRRVTIHGRERWRADCGIVEGTHQQPSFSTRQKAENFLAIAKSVKTSLGSKGLITYLAIKPTERHDIVRAKAVKTAAGIDASWEDIMTFYVSKRPKTAMVDIRDAVTAYLAAKREQRVPRKVSEAYVKELEYILDEFVEEHRKKQAHEFNETLIGEYLGEFDNDCGDPASRSSCHGPRSGTQIGKVGRND
jgi:hypothetical protein